MAVVPTVTTPWVCNDSREALALLVRGRGSTEGLGGLVCMGAPASVSVALALASAVVGRAAIVCLRTILGFGGTGGFLSSIISREKP